MLSSTQENSVADYYFAMLQSLNPNSKLDLISKLSQSLKEQKTTGGRTLEELYGAYQSDDTAEEMIAAIRNPKHNRD